MVLSYDYAKQKRRRWRTNAPPSLLISMAMQKRWSDTCGIARCIMSRATPEATGHRHRATTRSLSPQRLHGVACNKKTTKNAWCLLAISMAMAMRRYHTTRFAQKWGSMATAESTGRRHQVSIAADSINRSRKSQFFQVFSSSIRWKGGSGDVKAPNNNRGMTYQNDHKQVMRCDTSLGWLN